MTFEDRLSQAKKLVVSFLSDFVPPRGLDDQALARRISFVADSFARKMPTKGDYAEMVEGVLMRLRDTHNSNTWPSQAEFVVAMPVGERKEFASLQQFETNEVERYSEMMGEGLAVPEGALWGAMASALEVGPDVLHRYRRGSAARWQGVYKRDAHQMMRGKYGAVVDEYFDFRREAAE